MSQSRVRFRAPILILAIALTGCATTHTPPAGATEAQLQARARRVLAQTPLIDGHNDTPWQYHERVNNHLGQLDLAADTTLLKPPMHTDIARLRAGGVGGQFWSVFIPGEKGGAKPGDARTLFEQIDLARRMIDRYSDDLELAATADDVERIHREGKIAGMLGIEGGHSIEHSLAVLRIAYLAGARYMGLTHSNNAAWADSGTDDENIGGLSEFGKEVVREMNRLGMIVDLAHTSAGTMRDALAVTTAPVIFSHASARAVCDHPRNVPDDVLDLLKANDGVIMITFVPVYVSEGALKYAEDNQAARKALEEAHPDDKDTVEAGMDAWRAEHPRVYATISDVADHIDYVRDRIGIDHLGVGGDFDGIRSLPIGLEDVSKYPALFAELYRRGYSDEDIAGIAGKNVLRVMRGVEREAARLQRLRPPSDAAFEELDTPRADQ
ncbi:MAG: membrane dipeptidase [Phycisphaeraceae bacterium]|nr:membrane dipeptidase [Phycisphaeraceae bacterium]